ncbi:MAG TPA: isoprenylcysteine carboxylmethyltransferase family protein [Candidatus Cybelea sp.]|jgi:protein-S-isoprenylcysteine O-methyltransferase Ste14|nr:isoprenylcysteine carboxylmethyltransferase family protein [Candidatus Cybelea sp.]
MSFQATEFEFRTRFWFIFGIFWLGFLLYLVDPVNISVALSRLVLGGHPDESSSRFGHAVTVFFALGTLGVVVGALIRSWAESYLHSSIVHDRELHGEQLVADGPYRHVRNPLYLGNLLLAIGVGLLASRSGFLVISIGMWLFVYRLILREETTLLQSQGDSYRRYLAAVPRLLPSVTPRVPASGAMPNWLDGFTGELFMWSGAAAMAVFTATRSTLYFWVVFGLGMAIYFLQSYLRGRSKRAA